MLVSHSPSNFNVAKTKALSIVLNVFAVRERS